MKNKEDRFAEKWREAFEDARIPPGEGVWTGIDAELTRQEMKGYRRKVVIYKWMTAASLILALGLGYFALQNVPVYTRENARQGDDRPLAFISPPVTGPVTLPDQKAGPSDREDEGSPGSTDRRYRNRTGNVVANQGNPADGQVKGNLTITAQENQRDNIDGNKKTSTLALASAGEDTGTESIGDPPNQVDLQPAINPVSSLVLSIDQPEPGPVPGRIVNPYEQPLIEMPPELRKSDQGTAIFAGLGFSSGVFNPNITYGARNSLNSPLAFLSSDDAAEAAPALDADFNAIEVNRASAPERTEYVPEFSYNWGLNMGYQFDDRWMLLGGLSYAYNNSSTEINSYIENPQNETRIAYQILGTGQTGQGGINTHNTLDEEIRLYNAYEFLSLPVRVGYYLINNQLAWILTGGVSAEFLLQNRIYDRNNYLETVTLGSGDASPYHSTYVNGIVGTLVNYTVNDRYRISLEPTYRLGLSYLTREDAAFNSRPSSFFVSAGISYVFK